MRVHNCEQGSLEWARLRMGIPTASSFHKILTPTGKPSTQAEGYLHHLIAELLMGCPLDAPKTSWMQRGNEMEGEAVAFYEFDRDVALETVGFCTNDEETIGASPDRLLGDDGLVEIKCPSPQVHVAYLLYKDVDKEYRVQLQGQLYVTGREWVDICAYDPALPPVIVRVERDEKYIALLDEALNEFVATLEAEKARLIDEGYKLKERIIAEEVAAAQEGEA